MATTNNIQLKGAAEEMTVVAAVTGSGDDCNNGNNGSGDNGGSDDSGSLTAMPTPMAAVAALMATAMAAIATATV
jgi:hypothetical protein